MRSPSSADRGATLADRKNKMCQDKFRNKRGKDENAKEFANIHWL